RALGPRPPAPARFPYTTLFRSGVSGILDLAVGASGAAARRAAHGLPYCARPTCPAAQFPLRVTWRPARIDARPALLSEVAGRRRSEEHTSELQSRENLVCRPLL